MRCNVVRLMTERIIDGGRNGVGLVEISDIFVMQDEFFLARAQFDKVHKT